MLGLVERQRNNLRRELRQPISLIEKNSIWLTFGSMNRTHPWQPSSRVMGNLRSSHAAVGSDDEWCGICVNLGMLVITICLFCCLFSSQRTSVAMHVKDLLMGIVYMYIYIYINIFEHMHMNINVKNTNITWLYNYILVRNGTFRKCTLLHINCLFLIWLIFVVACSTFSRYCAQIHSFFRRRGLFRSIPTCLWKVSCQ